MARHSGKNGVVMFNDVQIGFVTNWSINESEGSADLTAAGDIWEDHDGTQKNWTAEVEMRLDHATGSNQTFRAGDVFDLQLYSEGDGAGRTFFEGSARLSEHSADSPYSVAVTRSYSFQGKGPLSVEVVT